MSSKGIGKDFVNALQKTLGGYQFDPSKGNAVDQLVDYIDLEKLVHHLSEDTKEEISEMLKVVEIDETTSEVTED